MAKDIEELPDTVSRWPGRGRIPEHAIPRVVQKGQARCKPGVILSIELIMRLNKTARPGRPRKIAQVAA